MDERTRADLDNIDALCKFAYEQGFHELGYDPVKDVSERIEALEGALRALMTNPHINLGDQIYSVREREGMGWDGPSVKAWSDAVQAAEKLLKGAHSAGDGNG